MSLLVLQSPTKSCGFTMSDRWFSIRVRLKPSRPVKAATSFATSARDREARAWKTASLPGRMITLDMITTGLLDFVL